MGMSHPLPASASRNQSPTWGSWGSGVTFLSLLSWELMETCGQQQRCHLRAAARREGGVFPPSSALPRFLKLPRAGWERDTSLPGNAGWLESLKVCGDAKEVAAETAASSATPPNAGDSPTC